MISSPRLPHPPYRATAIVIVPAHPADRPESPEACAEKVIDEAQKAADRQRFAIKGSA